MFHVPMTGSQEHFDSCIVIDEAGLTAKVRNLKPEQDNEIGLVAGIVFPSHDLKYWKNVFAPPYNEIVAAAPEASKLHITDAFSSDNSDWKIAAKKARGTIFQLIRDHNLLVVYTARYGGVSRRSHEIILELERAAKAQANPDISFSDNPTNERHISICYQGLVSCVEVLARTYNCKNIAIYSDAMDYAVEEDMEANADRLRDLSSRTSIVKAFDKKQKKKVQRKLRVSIMDNKDEIDVKRVGSLSQLGKASALVFAADVVTNSLLHNLSTRGLRKWLNNAASVESWDLADRVFTQPDDSYDAYNTI